MEAVFERLEAVPRSSSSGHSCVDEALGDPNNGPAVRKHLEQNAALLGILRDASLLKVRIIKNMQLVVKSQMRESLFRILQSTSNSAPVAAS